MYGKTTRSFSFEALDELRDLANKFPSTPLYCLKYSCTSFRNLESIKREYDKQTVRLQDGQVLTMMDYIKDRLVKLANPYIFECDTLRGYPNSYKIRWETETEIISAQCKTNLWRNVTRPIETDKDRYAEHTVRAVKLVSLWPDTLTAELNFSVIRWNGGNVTTYNVNESSQYVETFLRNLFYGETLNWRRS